MSEPSVYLAGPDVFLADAIAFADAKRQLCRRYGFVGRSPIDNELDIAGMPLHEAARRISAGNEAMIRQCNLVVANITPFRGPSADVGTVYEMGFARALGLPVFAYSNCAGTFLERTCRLLGNGVSRKAAGGFEDSYHLSIEDFDCVDNLMVVGAVLDSGTDIVIGETSERDRFIDLTGFEKCLRLAAEQFSLPKPPTAIADETC